MQMDGVNIVGKDAVDAEQRETLAGAHTWAERVLAIFMRVVAVVLMLGAVAIVMPFSWMAATHGSMGLGELPERPIVSYLARSVSALYAYQGIISLFLSFGVRRYRPLIRLLGWMAVIFGVLMVVVDVGVGMPWFWTVGEGPVVLVMGAFVLWLEGRVRAAGEACAGA